MSFLCIWALGACVELGPRGPYPRRVYTDLRTDLVFDGKRIIVEGTSQCTRSGDFNSSGEVTGLFLDATGPLYRCSPKWFGKRLPRGGALLVGAYSVTGKWGTFPDYAPPDLTKHRERVAKVPRAVIWLDDAENPTRGEYYYSSIVLDDSRSRLTKIESEIVDVRESSNALGTGIFEPVSDPAKEVPWVAGNKAPLSLTVRYANVVPKHLWSKISGLSEFLKKYAEPVVLYSGKTLFVGHLRGLKKAGLSRTERAHSFQWPSDEMFVFPGMTLRSSKGYFEQSLRRKAVQRGTDGILRFMDSVPKGVLPMIGADHQDLLVGADIAGKPLKVESDDWFRSYFYDPGSGNIYRFLGFRFAGGRTGNVYR